MAVRGVGLRTIISNCSYIFLFLPNDKIVLKSTGCIQSSLVLFLNSPCVTNINIFCSQYHYNIVKWTGIKWEQGQITACKGHFFNTKLSKLNEKCMVNRRIFIWKSCEWIKGSPNISTKLTIYYVCRLTEFEDICASGCCSREFPLNFDWMSNVEKKCWKVSLRKAGFLCFVTGVHRSACFQTLDVILWDRRPKHAVNFKTSIYMKTWKIRSCRPRICRIWQAFLSWMSTVQAIATCLQENLSTICCP